MTPQEFEFAALLGSPFAIATMRSFPVTYFPRTWENADGKPFKTSGRRSAHVFVNDPVELRRYGIDTPWAFVKFGEDYQPVQIWAGAGLMPSWREPLALLYYEEDDPQWATLENEAYSVKDSQVDAYSIWQRMFVWRIDQDVGVYKYYYDWSDQA
jgi:hypothetical protein